MTTLAIPTELKTAQKLKRARAIYAQIIESEGALKRNYRAIRADGFLFGETLTEIKEEIGHGNWLLWLEGNWPDLCERKAQLCMQFFKGNPQIRANPRNSSDLHRLSDSEWNSDSFRKLMWGYIPAKERPALAGDESVSTKPHYLSFVNHFVKWDRSVLLGHVVMPPLPQFRKELESPLKRIIEIGGREWAESLIAG